MPTSIQCQACGKVAEFFDLGGDELPWKCGLCGARHTVSVSGGFVRALRLQDRFFVPLSGLRCSSAVLDNLQEAARALNADAPRASVVMVRRALEQACNDMGGNGKHLVDKIDDLGRKGTFTRAHAAAATAMRLFGNYGAHPTDDLLDNADMKRAEHALRLAVDLLEDPT